MDGGGTTINELFLFGNLIRLHFKRQCHFKETKSKRRNSMEGGNKSKLPDYNFTPVIIIKRSL